MAMRGGSRVPVLLVARWGYGAVVVIRWGGRPHVRGAVGAIILRGRAVAVWGVHIVTAGRVGGAIVRGPAVVAIVRTPAAERRGVGRARG
jgi:hypothetical protein